MWELMNIIVVVLGIFTHSAGDARSDASIILEWRQEEPIEAIVAFADGEVCYLLGQPNTCETGDIFQDFVKLWVPEPMPIGSVSNITRHPDIYCPVWFGVSTGKIR